MKSKIKIWARNLCIITIVTAASACQTRSVIKAPDAIVTAVPPVEYQNPSEMNEETSTSYEVNGKMQAAYQEFVKKSGQLFFQSLNQDGKSRIYSPMSIYMNLAMLEKASVDASQKALRSVLTNNQRIPGSEVDAYIGYLNQLYNYELSKSGEVMEQSHSLWLRDDYEASEAYLTDLAQLYHCDTYTWKIDQEDAIRESMIQWIQDKSRSKIGHESLPETFPDSENVFTMMNTMYYKVGWMHEFEVKNTKSNTFTNAKGTTEKTDFMAQKLLTTAAVKDAYQLADFPLSDGANLRVLLPNPDVQAQNLIGDPQFLEDLFLSNETDTKNSYIVDCLFPKFSINSTQMDLIPILNNLGLEEQLKQLDLSKGIPGLHSVAIEEALHTSYIQFDEKGLEATDVTVIIPKIASKPEEEIKKLSMHLTRPFYFSIFGHNGELLFTSFVTSVAATK